MTVRPKPAPAFVRSIANNLIYWQQRIAALIDAEKGTLDSDKDNLLQAIRYGLGIEEMRGAATQVALDACSFVERAGYHREWIALLAAIIEHEWVLDLELKCALLNRLGQLHYQLLELHLAAECLTLARELAAQDGYVDGHGRALWHLGEVRQREGAYNEAEQLLLEARTVLADVALYASPYAAASNALGLLYLERGEFEAAEITLLEATEVARIHGYTTDHARILSNLSELYLRRRRFDDCLSFLDRADVLLIDPHYKVDRQFLRWRRAQVFVSQENWQAAENAARLVDVDYLQQVEQLQWVATIRVVLGQILVKQQKYVEAEVNLREGIAVAERANDPIRAAFGATELAHLLVERERFTTALTYYDKAELLAVVNPDNAFFQALRDEIEESRTRVMERMQGDSAESPYTPTD